MSAAAAITSSPLATGNGVAAFHQSASAVDYRRAVAGMNTANTSNSVYMSFWLRVDGITTIGASLDATMMTWNSTTVFPARVMLGAPSNTTHFDLGVSVSGNINPTTATTTINLNVGQPYFVVMANNFNPGAADDTATLWINPSEGQASPPAPLVTSGTGTDGAAPTDIAIRQGSNQRMTFSIDEIRVGNAWTDVTFTGTARVEDWSTY